MVTSTNFEKQPLVQAIKQPGFDKQKRPSVGYKWSSVFLARLVSCVSGLGSGYEGGTFGAIAPDLKIEFGLSASAMGLLASLPVVILAIASFLGGMLANTVGRKPALASSFVMLIFGSLLQALATSLAMFAVGRCVVCAGCGAGASIVTIYMAEVTPASYRGMFVSMEEFFINAGLLLAFYVVWFFMDSNLGWRVTVGMGAVLPACALVLLSLPQVPESPRYYYMRGQLEEAKKAMSKLVQDEDEIQRTIAAWEQEAPRPFMKALKQTPRGALVAAFGLGMCSCSGGVHAINGLLNYVFTHVMQHSTVGHGARHMAANWGVLIMFAKAVLLVPVCLCFLDQVGRRPLLMMSASCMAIGTFLTMSALALGLSDFLVGAGIAILLVSFSLGLGPVPFAYCAEVLPTEVRGPGFGFILLSSRMFVSAQLFVLPMALEFSVWLPFALYFVANMLVVAFVYWFCPETSGRKLEDMSALFE